MAQILKRAYRVPSQALSNRFGDELELGLNELGHNLNESSLALQLGSFDTLLTHIMGVCLSTWVSIRHVSCYLHDNCNNKWKINIKLAYLETRRKTLREFYIKTKTNDCSHTAMFDCGSESNSVVRRMQTDIWEEKRWKKWDIVICYRDLPDMVFFDVNFNIIFCDNLQFFQGIGMFRILYVSYVMWNCSQVQKNRERRKLLKFKLRNKHNRLVSQRDKNEAKRI